ncbi:TspO/MBR family protein [Nereida sp. MMG025]|uniref:tryptophan-rich sensory protein TspO n=1 Tax=Nereida sp. MMG025 TaxID=2909981 RepID=UPI001F36D55C|nr:TspO/MBR family protein [Nereida sp. MMG025]MCF6445993.1 tryptophan-rich sensory protein [Nereida sp. MMG025]
MDWSIFIVFMAASCTAAATGSLFPPDEWYRTLNKPTWTPPDWAFPLTWVTLYILSSIAATLIAAQSGVGLALAFWAFQIAANTLWSPVFFGLKRIKAAMLALVVLWVAVAGTLVTFWMVDAIAGALMIPYLIWVSIAGALNWWILQNNPQEVAANP